MINLMATSWARGADNATRQAERRGVKFSAFAEVPVVPPHEAIKWLQGRVPLPLARIEELVGEVQVAAQKITTDLLETIADRIDGSIKRAVERGDSMGRFLSGLDKIADAAGLTKANPYYWETVFRNNVQNAYGAGRWEMFDHPDVRDAFPFFQYFTVGDSAVRPEHAALHGLVFRRDDPNARKYWAPLDHGCRCMNVAVSQEEMDDEGLTVTETIPTIDGKTVEPGEGWAGLPQDRFEKAGAKMPKTPVVTPTKPRAIPKPLVTPKIKKPTEDPFADLDKATKASEVEKWAKQNMKTDVAGLRGASLDYSKEVLRSCHEIERRLGKAIPAKIEFGKVRARSAFATFDPRTNTINFRKRVNLDVLGKSLESSNRQWMKEFGPETPYFSANGTRGIVYHEVGHAIDYNAKGTLRRHFARMSPAERKKVFNVSGYAGHDYSVGDSQRYSETWAECFAAVGTNSTRARFVPGATQKIIEGLLK